MRVRRLRLLTSLAKRRGVISEVNNNEYDLSALLSAECSEEEFKRMYMCKWKQDPIMQECVAFMRYATTEKVAVYKRDGLFTAEQIREAKRIIEIEESR